MSDKWVHVQYKQKWKSPIEIHINNIKLEPEMNRVFYGIEVTIKNANNALDVSVTEGPDAPQYRKWEVWRSYREFYELKQSLGLRLGLKFQAHFPAKSYKRGNLTPEELEVRRVMLQDWLSELCTSESFLFAARRPVLENLNEFLKAKYNGGVILLRHLLGNCNDTPESAKWSNSITISKSEENLNQYSQEQGSVSTHESAALMNEQYSELVQDIAAMKQDQQSGWKKYITSRHHAAAATASGGIGSSHGVQHANVDNTLLFPISIEFLLTHCPCKLHLEPILDTCNHTPESLSANCVDETDFQLEKDYRRDRLVIQGHKVSGSRLKSIKQLVTFMSNLAKICVFNTPMTDSDDGSESVSKAGSGNMEDSYYQYRDSDVYEMCHSRVNSIEESALGNNKEWSSGGLPHRHTYSQSSSSPPLTSSYMSYASPTAKPPPLGKTECSVGCTCCYLCGSVPTSLMSFLCIGTSAMETDQQMNVYCLDNGIDDDGLEKYCKEILTMASRTNSAYSVNIALQIILGIMKPTRQMHSKSEKDSVRDSQSLPVLNRNPFSFNSFFALPSLYYQDSEPVDGEIGSNTQFDENSSRNENGQLIISADSSLARPIYLQFKWQQLPRSALKPSDSDQSADSANSCHSGRGVCVDAPGNVNCSRLSPSNNSNGSGGSTPPLPSTHIKSNGSTGNSTNSSNEELIWCLVCDIKCATVYKVLHSDNIEEVLLRLKVTYYKQYIYNDSKTYGKGDINRNAQLFLDQDVKLSAAHNASTWVSAL